MIITNLIFNDNSKPEENKNKTSDKANLQFYIKS